LAYPAPPHDLWPSPARVSGGFPSRQPSVAEAAERRPSWPLPLLQSARGYAGTALRWFLLSWDWGPCRRCTSRASTPGSRSSRRTGAARCQSCSALVVSHHLDGLLRAEVVGLLHPTTGQGFTAFRACRQGVARRRLGAGISSRGAVRTLRRVSLVSSRKRITAAVAFLSLPSCPAMDAGRSRYPGRPRSPLTRGAYDRRASLGRGDRAPKGEGADPYGRGIQAPKSKERPGPGTDGRRSEEHRHRDPARWVTVPKSRGPASVEWGVPAVPGGDAPTPKSRESESGGTGEGGAPKSTVAESRRPVAGAPKSLRGLVARAPKSRGGRVPSGWVRRSEDMQARLDGGGPLRRVGGFRRSRDRSSRLRRATAASPE
jgi:hypothetical protein